MGSSQHRTRSPSVEPPTASSSARCRIMAEEGPVASPSHNPTLGPCSDWVVISSPNGGLNAAADINHDEIVNAADIGLLVAAWGDAPRNPMPPSDCPLGLIP